MVGRAVAGGGSLRLAAGAGLMVSLLAIFFTIYPIIDVPSPLAFAAKIIAVTLVANLIGITIFALNYKRRGPTALSSRV